jgi:hypothetical protein
MRDIRMTATTLFGLPWYVWGLLCLVVAAIYLVVWPRPSRKSAALVRPSWRQFVLRWFHSLVWALLALSCFVQASQIAGSGAVGGGLAILAGLLYLIFIGALVADARIRR